MKQGGKDTENRCLNCHTLLPENAIYCPKCGQKDKDTKVSFLRIVGEAVATLLNLESALFRTLPNLLIPGKLTLEFFKGKQKKYMNPVRLFLWVSLILVALLTFRSDGADVINLNKELLSEYKQSWEMKRALSPLDSAMEKTQNLFPYQNLRPVFDSIRAQYLQNIPLKDSLDMNKNFRMGVEDSLVVSLDDLYELNPDSLLNKYQVEGFWNRIITKQKIKFLVDGKSFGTTVIGKLTWALFFLLPMLALGLKVVYIRRGFFYVEHLILAVHVHTFAFLLFILMLLAEPLLKTNVGPAWGILLLVIGLYVLFAQKLYYRQGWAKTILKFILIQIYYYIMLSIAMGLALVIGFFLF
ncbi:MAG: DUF3667 domain-containing protein [Saprospirales bacterium]|nr:DUF3667 domain-containing protein [Saprospirales bacterium]